MQISELSRQSGVSIATIKYYVREGLLAAAAPTSAKRSDYNEQHLRRLRLIRALIDIGELSIASVRDALRAMDTETVTLHDAFGKVMHRLDHPPESDVDTTAVQQWLTRRNWTIEPDAPAIRSLAGLIETLHQFDFPVGIDDFDMAAEYYEAAATFETAYARSAGDRTAALETMLIGTVVVGRALSDVRRLALEAMSHRQEWAGSPVPTGSAGSPGSPASAGSSSAPAPDHAERPSTPTSAQP